MIKLICMDCGDISYGMDIRDAKNDMCNHPNQIITSEFNEHLEVQHDRETHIRGFTRVVT